MQPGVSSFAFGWAVQHAPSKFTERQLIAFAAGHQARVVQFGDNMPLHALSTQRIRALVSAAAAAQLTIEVGARGLTDAHLATYLPICRIAGARLLRFVVDANGYEPSPDAVVSLLRNALRPLDDAGVTLALENHDRFKAATLRRIVDDVGSRRVGICLDTANSLGAGEGLEHVTSLLAPVTVNLHVKDVLIARLPSQMGFVVEGRPLGRGQLPLFGTLARVFAEGRCESAILENWTPPQARRRTTCEVERASAELGLQQLRAWIAQLEGGQPAP